MKKGFTALLLATIFPTASVALSPLEREILEELSCEVSPMSLEILTELTEAKKIIPEDNIGYDSLSCWTLLGGLNVAGMRFDSICAYEEDPELQRAHPEFYYRGPGTSPGQHLSLGTSVSVTALVDWSRSIFGPGKVSSAISSDGSILEGLNDVTCSRFLAASPRP
ncbi:hypothetical protein [Celeribacter sp. PS-C1]|uniref:hypothetical protein n=1 Tax=Celeribacter sp. PS-C1 TaxID=2820813 RepID=UPI001CA48A3F|nr:hypothetical protein [Celeribacter sp. PS-C1]MBW6416712.1 hypothetical protein [Celeribacter sp. PS-C1]